jgi:hypothetical protein
MGSMIVAAPTTGQFCCEAPFSDLSQLRGRYRTLAVVVLGVTFGFFPRRGGTLRGAAAGIGGHIVKMFGTRFTVALYDVDALSGLF